MVSCTHSWGTRTHLPTAESHPWKCSGSSRDVSCKVIGQPGQISTASAHLHDHRWAVGGGCRHEASRADTHSFLNLTMASSSCVPDNQRAAPLSGASPPRMRSLSHCRAQVCPPATATGTYRLTWLVSPLPS